MFYPQNKKENGAGMVKNKTATSAPLQTQIPPPSMASMRTTAGRKRETLFSPPEIRPPFRPSNRNLSN